MVSIERSREIEHNYGFGYTFYTYCTLRFNECKVMEKKNDSIAPQIQVNKTKISIVDKIDDSSSFTYTTLIKIITVNCQW